MSDSGTQDPSGVTTQTLYSADGTESIIQTYNVSLGQPALDIDPTDLPGGDYIINLNIANTSNPSSTTALPTLSLQYGPGTASLIATYSSTGAVSTLATVHDVATTLFNGQWEPVQGPLEVSSLALNGFDIDTGPHILVDQSGGSTTNPSLSLSGNVIHPLPGELFNFAEGEVVNIFDNGVQVGSSTIQTVNAPGTHTYLGPNDTAWDASINLTPGDNAITITTTDPNGLTGSASLDYTYNAPGAFGTGSTATASGAAGSAGGSGSTGTTAASGASSPSDSISLDPAVAFLGRGVFELTGHAASPAGVRQVELSAQVNGVTTDLGPATVNPDGSFTFEDDVGRNLQGFVTATMTDGAGQHASATADYALQAGIAGRPFVAVQDTYDNATGAVASIARFNANGGRTVQVLEAGQALTSNAFDTFLDGARPDTTFVFDPGYGQDVVQMMRAVGTDHDTLSLPASDFASIADVLAHTSQYKGTAIIQDPVSGDVLRLAGVSKGELFRNQGDITLHA